MSGAREGGWRKRILLFLISQCVTLFGSTLVQMAMVWYVTLATASGAWVGAFSVVSYLPQFLVSFAAGAWADRYSRKALILGADLGIAAVTLGMIFAMPFLEGAPQMLWALLVLAALRSIGAGIQTPAVNAVIPTLVPEGRRMRFNGIQATLQSIVQFAAPAAAGAVLTVSSLRTTLWLDVLTAAIGVGIAALIPIARIKRSEAAGSVLREMKEGMAYALSDREIRKILAVYGLSVFFCVPGGYLAGLFVGRFFGNTYGNLAAVELVGFAGMTLGGILLGAWGGFKDKKRTLALGCLAFGVAGVLMGISSDFRIYLALMALYGVALTAIQTTATTLLQEKARPAMLGRVFGLLSALYAGFLPAGMAIFGPMADRISLRWLMIASGLAAVLQTGWIGRGRAFRKPREAIAPMRLPKRVRGENAGSPGPRRPARRGR